MYLRNWKACGWNKGYKRMKSLQSEKVIMEKWHSTALRSPVQGVCAFGPDTEDAVGVAQYLVTISSSSLYPGE